MIYPQPEHCAGKFSLGMREEKNTNGREEMLSRHHEYVKRVTPPEKLFFFDVKQGWGPLCKILNVPVPDEPFPHANDANAVQAAFVTLLKRAAFRWLQWFAMAGVFIWATVYVLKR